MCCTQSVCCVNGGGDEVVRMGKSPSGEQCYRCKRSDCPTLTFMLKYRNKAYGVGMKRQVVDRALNASGVHDTRPGAEISKGTGQSTR